MRNGRNFSSHFVFLLFCLSSAPASASYSSLTFSDLLSASGVLRRSFGLIPEHFVVQSHPSGDDLVSESVQQHARHFQVSFLEEFQWWNTAVLLEDGGGKVLVVELTGNNTRDSNLLENALIEKGLKGSPLALVIFGHNSCKTLIAQGQQHLDIDSKIICHEGFGAFKEVYKVHPDDEIVRTNLLPQRTSSDVWRRRKDLHGRLFRAAGVVNNDNYMLNMIDHKLQGHLVDIFLELVKTTNMTFTFENSVDGLFGSLVSQDSSEFNGLIGMIQRDEIDFAVSDLSFSQQRKKVVDNLFPIYDYFHSLIYWRPDSKVGWAKYTSVFDNVFWLMLLLTTVLSSIAVWFYKEKQGKGNMLEAAGFVLACLCNRELDQDIARSANMISQRLFLVTVLITGFLIFTVYNAVLTSHLAVDKINFPYQTVMEIVESDLNLLVPGGTYPEEVMKTSVTELGELYQRKKMEGKIKDIPWKMDVSGSIKMMRDEGFVLVAGVVSMDTMADYFCDIVDVPVLRSQSGFTVKKGSRYTDLFNYHLQRMNEAGVMGKLHRKYSSSPFISSKRRAVNADCSGLESSQTKELGYKSVFLGFAIAAFGALAAMTLALAEKGSKVAGKLVARERRNNDE